MLNSEGGRRMERGEAAARAEPRRGTHVAAAEQRTGPSTDRAMPWKRESFARQQILGYTAEQ